MRKQHWIGKFYSQKYIREKETPISNQTRRICSRDGYITRSITPIVMVVCIYIVMLVVPEADGQEDTQIRKGHRREFFIRRGSIGMTLCQTSKIVLPFRASTKVAQSPHRTVIMVTHLALGEI